MIVRQVRNAFDVLEFFANRGTPAGIAKIADYFGWPRSSTFNLVETLLAAGVLHEPRHRGGYFPTGFMQHLANRIAGPDILDAALHQMISDIATESGETTAIVGFSGPAAVFLDVVESSQAIRYFACVGERVPLFATAAGRALLSQIPDAARQKFLAKQTFVQHAADTLMSVSAVEAEIAASRVRGFFINTNGFAPGLTGIAVPLENKGNQLALLVAGPAERLQGRETELAKLLHRQVP